MDTAGEVRATERAPKTQPDAERLFAGPGETRSRCRALDWAATPLGPVERWPASLRATAPLVLAHPFATILLWGPELVQIYNDAYRALMGVEHPAGLGQPTRECRPEVWHTNAPIYERVWRGESVSLEDAIFPITRSGVLQDAWFTLSYSPAYDESGAVAGVFLTIFETTARVRAEAALRARGALYRHIVEGARDYAIFTTDAEGRIESWSPGAEAVLGWTAAEAVGRPFETTFTPEDRARGEPARELAEARDEGVAPDVRWHLGKDGTRIFIDGTTRAMRDDAGRLQGFLKVGQDVTRRRALDEALRASEARFRTLVENVQDYAIFMLNPDGRITEWTAGAERVKGYTAEEALGQDFSLFYTPEDVAAGEPARDLAEAAATGRVEREGWRARQGGERFWANEITSAVRSADGTLFGFAKVCRDLTARRRAAEVAERVQAAAERDALRGRMVEVEEGERRRLARELHDELGQHLAALGLGLQALSDVAPPGSDVDRRAAQLRTLVNTMGQEMHALAVRLRPKALDDFGLEAALAAYCQEWSRQSGIAVAIHARTEAGRLPDAVESALYRVVQEALTNVAKHSGATQVSVVVERREGHIHTIIEDNGRGFDVAASEAAYQRDARRGGLGLLGIQERVALLGGTVDVESATGGGTTLFVRIPIDGPAGNRAAGRSTPHRGHSRG